MALEPIGRFHEHKTFPTCPYCDATDENIDDHSDDCQLRCHACKRYYFLEVRTVKEFTSHPKED